MLTVNPPGSSRGKQTLRSDSCPAKENLKVESRPVKENMRPDPRPVKEILKSKIWKKMSKKRRTGMEDRGFPYPGSQTPMDIAIPIPVDYYNGVFPSDPRIDPHPSASSKM